MSRRVTVGTALAAAVLGAGSGCGVTGTDFRPGVAARSATTGSTTDDVDDAADDACDYFTDQEQRRGVPEVAAARRAAADSSSSGGDRAAAATSAEVAAPAVPASSIDDFVDQQFAGATERQADGLEHRSPRRCWSCSRA